MESLDKASILRILTPEFIGKHSVLNIVAQFWDAQRQAAFIAAYRTMRFLDDLVDKLKEAHGGIVPPDQQETIEREITAWLECLKGGRAYNQHQQELLDIMKEFKIPAWPWERLATAMIYDIKHNGFTTYDDFLDYAEGAAVAPGAVAMHLGGLSYSNNEYQIPNYDIGAYARPLAQFAYLVHIIRDFQEDQLKDLNYFSDDLLERCRLDRSSIKSMAEKGEATPALRKMMEFYHRQAETYRINSRAMLDQLARSMEPRYVLSLEVLFGLYGQVFDRIDVRTGNFTTKELNSSPEEKFACIQKIVTSFTM